MALHVLSVLAVLLSGLAARADPKPHIIMILQDDLAVDAIANHDAETPLFMYLAWQAVHTPYDPVPDWDDRYCYGYSEQGMWDNTLIVYSSDNGGVEDGINYPLRGEKHSNWQGGMHVASFVSGGLVPANLRGSESFVNVHIADWYPTFAKLAGQDPADDPPVAPLPVDLQDVIKLLVAQNNFKTQNNGWKVGRALLALVAATCSPSNPPPRLMTLRNSIQMGPGSRRMTLCGPVISKTDRWIRSYPVYQANHLAFST
ncbi:uncharacterized protein MONBRDRAFT_11152 [Monosiga brevicollis MX1]|uniref:Sulfatase N-terminal domain-containing protein n=1 Tax=Monosiga brevicollis TaxID=81824 RepID=A9V8C9_MONBE|nr:uncharacterized protein MONBRDRAFT_11152 [Monosiga brevicollis MX1]EDQ86316.1 predicted protein [Monosiga brevicollis MX1]|eukprot:XP_001748986.1 hypothetical protein [Monosiga brevicollis MX1]